MCSDVMDIFAVSFVIFGILTLVLMVLRILDWDTNLPQYETLNAAFPMIAAVSAAGLFITIIVRLLWTLIANWWRHR